MSIVLSSLSSQSTSEKGISTDRSINNFTLDNRSIYVALFFTQLTAIIAQGSLRSSPIELFIQIVIWGVLLGLSLSFGWQYRGNAKSKLPEQLTNISAIIGIGAFLFQIVNGDLTAGLLLMLSWLLIGLSCSLSKQRSLYFSLIASTVLLLYAASLSRSSSFIIYTIIFTLSAVIALAGNFYLTKNKQQISTQLHSDSINTDFPYKLPITIISSTILLLTTALYLLVPRPDALHWGNFPAGGGQYQAKADWPKEKEKSGNSNTKGKKQNNNDDKKDPNDSNQSDKNDSEQPNDGDAFEYNGLDEELSLNEDSRKSSGSSSSSKNGGGGASSSRDNSIIFYMEGKSPQYLRGKVFDYFDGLSWKTTHQKLTRLDKKTGEYKITPELKSPYDQYTITMVRSIGGNDSIFIPAGTAELKFPSNAIAIDNYGTVSSPRPLSKGTFYSFKVESNGLKINGRPVDPVQTMHVPDSKELSRFKQLPDDLSAQFIAFSDVITKDSSNVLEKASKVEQFLRKNYKYSLESVYSSQGKIPLEEFLFDTKLGHCEYFATAMVTLMRAQDIPARLVTGFSVSEYNPVTGFYEARSLNAHAWAEVWVENVGWVTFEATPAYPLPKPQEAQNTSESIEDYLTERSKQSQLSDPDSLSTKLLNTAKNLFEQFNLILHKTWNNIKSGLSWSGHMLLSYGWLLLIALIIFYSAYHYLRYFIIHYRAKKSLLKAKKKSAHAQIEISYQAMQKIFTLHKHPKADGLTIQQYQQKLEEHYPELVDSIKAISDNLNTSLYHDRTHNSKLGKSTREHAKKIIKHKFKTPIPAEKQIHKVRDFFRKFTSRKEQENQYT